MLRDTYNGKRLKLKTTALLGPILAVFMSHLKKCS